MLLTTDETGAAGGGDNTLDPFDMAFNEATVTKTPEEIAAEEAAAAAAADTKTPEEIAAEEAAAATKTPEEIAAEEAAAAAAAAADKKDDPLAAALARADAAEKTAADLQRSLDAKKPVEQTAEEKAAADKAIADAAALKAESDAEWAEFKKDWKEPAEMMEKMYQGIMTQVGAMINSALSQFAETSINPLLANTAQTEQDKFKSAVTAVHADAFDLIKIGDVDKWIATLPAYLQVGVNKVLDSGTPTDVIAVIDDFKKATGKTAPEKTAEEIAAEKDAETERKRKLNGLKAVPDRRTVVTGEADPNDFEGAFKQAVASS